MIESVENLDLTESYPGMFEVQARVRVRADDIGQAAVAVKTALLRPAEDTK